MGIRVGGRNSVVTPTTSLPSKQTRQPQKKRVRFGKDSYAKEDVYFLDDEQKSQVWYSDDEETAMHRDLFQVLEGNASNEPKRGLELMSNPRQKHAVKMMHQLLLTLQDENRDEGFPDATGLKELSLRLTRHDVMEAVIKAAQDAMDANRIYQETFDPNMVKQCFM